MIIPMIYNSDFIKSLSSFNEPNTIYAFMESIVNYDRDENDKVKIKDLSKYARTTIFDFEYPVSDLFGKENFEELFLNHYMFRRINFDTLTSFKIHLQVKLNDIMPKYNKMIEGFNKIAFDGIKETHIRTQESESNINSSNNDTSKVKYSDTPEGKLEEVEDGTYLTEYTYNQANGESNSNSTGNTSENIEINKGDSIEEYRKFLEITDNIYSLIFKECDCLFYGLIS